MSGTNDAGAAKAARLATRQAPLALDRLMLIGIVGRADAPAALLRTPDGTILKLSRGDSTPGGVVTGIDGDRVVIVEDGAQRVLRIPGS